ncbi:alpha/beta hydrolase [Cellvibrio sp. KY-GH-1]|uniref:alpha/beta hydrolase n=1 Tax=Cellvibrio sp. KY-GH-1 TaxID=2303332 RepID=UPI001246D6D6|nr:alpha/beta hydrolase [Cellvibrio sp. KY-GH-1]QEY17672.1 alpha/beta hydrolase [Cellvibrio sp. KY-GH-1]
MRSSLRLFFILCTAILGVTANAADVKIHKAIEFAKPDNFPLTLDIYVPQTGKKSYPVLVIYHGGGWLLNNNSIMHDLANKIARDGDMVVANMNYRLLADQNNTVAINQIIEDVFGGLLWVKDHIAEYRGDPTRVAITGDSAGGHLTTMILTRGRQLESDGFAGPSLGFKPSYLPAGKTAEQVAQEDGLKVQAAVVSYGAFDLYKTAQGDFETPKNMFWKFANAEARGMFGNKITTKNNADYYKAVSPIYWVPVSSEYKLPPQFVHVGSLDKTTPPEAAQAYVDLLTAGKQPVEYKVYPGKNHAYLDNGCNWANSCFDKDAVEPVNDIIAFLRKTLKD